MIQMTRRSFPPIGKCVSVLCTHLLVPPLDTPTEALFTYVLQWDPIYLDSKDPEHLVYLTALVSIHMIIKPDHLVGVDIAYTPYQVSFRCFEHNTCKLYSCELLSLVGFGPYNKAACDNYIQS